MRTRGRRLRQAVYPFLLAPALWSCNGMEVKSEYGPGSIAGFASTFDWMSFATVSGDSRLADPRLNEFIREIIELELLHKGYEKRPGAGGLLVTYSLASDMLLNPKGSLSIKIIDSKSKDLMWTGRANAKADPSLPPKERRERLREAVRHIFGEFPSPGDSRA